MSETKKERLATPKERLANVRRWRVQHGLEHNHPHGRRDYDRKINSMAEAFQRRGVMS